MLISRWPDDCTFAPFPMSHMSQMSLASALALAIAPPTILISISVSHPHHQHICLEAFNANSIGDILHILPIVVLCGVLRCFAFWGFLDNLCVVTNITLLSYIKFTMFDIFIVKCLFLDLYIWLYQTGLNRDVRAGNTLLSIIGIRIVVIQELLNKVGKREIGEEVKKIGGVGLRHSDHPEKVKVI